MNTSASAHDGAPLSVLLAGGGSAGHVSPLLALADALRRLDPETEITVLGTAEGLEARLVPARGYELVTIPKVPLPRRPSAALLSVPGKLAGAITQTVRILRERDVDVVVGMGGYVSPPAYLAARAAGVPIVVHEQNARAGIANKLGARLTRSVATVFDGTGLPHARRIGMPLRPEITALGRLSDDDRAQARARAREALGLHPDYPLLLVTGGSLGAQRINEAMTEVVADVHSGRDGARPFQVLHLTGIGKAAPVEAAVAAAAQNAPEVARLYVVREYSDAIEQAYAAADLVLCRAGANTVAELTCVGLPAVYVPLPIGNGEQRLNAEPVVEARGGQLIENAGLTGEVLRARVLPLLRDRERLSAAAAAARGFGTRDADVQLADMVYAAAGHPRRAHPGPPAPESA